MSRTVARLLVATTLGLVIGGCGAEGDIGAGGTAGAGTAPSFLALDRDVLARRCTAACHSGGEFAAGGLDLASDAHGVLLAGPPETGPCAGLGLARVVPGRPDESLLYLKIVAKGAGMPPPCGEAMPSGANKAALTTDEIEQVRVWIAAGARND